MWCEGIDIGREYGRAKTMFITKAPQVSGGILLYNISLFGGPYTNWSLERPACEEIS